MGECAYLYVLLFFYTVYWIERFYLCRQLCLNVLHKLFDYVPLKRLDVEAPIFYISIHVDKISLTDSQFSSKSLTSLSFTLKGQRFKLSTLESSYEIISQMVTDGENIAIANIGSRM